MKEWIELYSGKWGSAIRWLVEAIENCQCSGEIKEKMFADLKVFVTIRFESPFVSRTTARCKNRGIFYHSDELIRKVDPLNIISQPAGKPISLSLKEQEEIMTTQKAVLLSLYRETDPVTSGNTKETMMFDMGRGIHIALSSMIPSKRYPFESYIGFMAYKNTVPVSYGGAWIYGNRARIGVNVFAPYRGGESALLFCNIIRLYHSYFGVNSFAVDPYQIGKNNTEGLKSGAFWFYYRLGFRPQQDKYKQLSESEFMKISADRTYHSPLTMMKQLSNSVMQLDINKMESDADAADISLHVSEVVTANFKGDLVKAEKASVAKMISMLGISDLKKYTPAQQKQFAQQALMYARLDEIKEWGIKDRERLADLMLAKGGNSEAYYALALLKHRKLHVALNKILRN